MAGFGGMAAERENKKLRQVHGDVIRLFGSYLSRHKRQLLLAMLFMTVVALANMAAPWLAKVAIDNHIVTGDRRGLTLILVLYLAVYAVFWGASYMGTLLSHRVGHRLIAEVRRDLVTHVTELPISFFTGNRTGEILTRTTIDVNNLSELITNGITNLTGDLLTLVGVMVMMFLMNARLAGIVLLIVPIILFGVIWIGRFMRKAYGSIREVSGKMNAGVEENLAGIRVVKSMSQEKANRHAFEALNMASFKAQIKASGATALVFPFMTFTSALSTALIVLFGGWMLLEGDGSVTIGMLLAFISYTNRFFIPLRDISQVYGTYQNAAASAERIHQYLSMPVAIQSPERPVKPVLPVKGEIRLEDVSFAYDPGTPILEGLNLTLPAGRTTAIVGPTGAGKSTLIRLIARLYDVQHGAVRIDGVDVRSLSLPALRRMVLLVTQEVFLFDDTLRENIRYGRPDASDAEVEAAARAACADNFIQGLPQGYDTIAGEGGIRLSGGQQQLIAFARAILADRPILILDEATSSVDAATEHLVQQAMDRLVAGRTVLIVAHRFTTLKRAEKIVVMDKGQVVAYDTHSQLLENSPLYRELYQRQWSGATAAVS